MIKKHRHMEFVQLMKALIALFEPHTYVEIGVQRGFTFSQIAPLVKRAVAVDINPVPFPMPGNGEFHCMPSYEFAKAWKDPIDLLFIDGDHAFKSVENDLEILSPFVREHTGLILLHDTYPVLPELEKEGFCFDAWRAARNVHLYDKRFEIVTLPGPWAGLSILRKCGASHLHWKGDDYVESQETQTLLTEEANVQSGSGENLSASSAPERGDDHEIRDDADQGAGTGENVGSVLSGLSGTDHSHSSTGRGKSKRNRSDR